MQCVVVMSSVVVVSVAIIRCAAYRQRQSVILFYDTGYLFQIKTQLIHLCGMSIEEAYGQKEKM